jgi:hypothetical protein
MPDERRHDDSGAFYETIKLEIPKKYLVVKR